VGPNTRGVERSPGAGGRDDVAHYFDEYVFGFMRTDIEREVNLARGDRGGGNVLAALGLLVWTEALGRIRLHNRPGLKVDGVSANAKAFHACFDLMGPGYRRWRRDFYRREKQTVYRAFRHGMAHEYAPKVPTMAVMLGTPRVALRKRGRTYVFVVEAYLRDFMSAAMHLRAELMRLQDPTIPPPG
jgi:hypothetical protein